MAARQAFCYAKLGFFMEKGIGATRVTDRPTAGFAEVLAALLERRELSAEQIGDMFAGLLSGEFHDGEAAAFLVALRMKGEPAGELAAAAILLPQPILPFATAPAHFLHPSAP